MVRTASVLFLLLGLAPALPVAAGNGTDAVPFLKVDTGARSAGMGGAFAAVADDASAVFHNPAGLALADRKEVMVSHAEWLEGIRNESLSYVQPAGAAWSLGAGAAMLFSGDIKRYDRAGAAAGNFTESEGFVSLGAALALGENFSAGAALKKIFQKLDKESASAYAADAGLLYHDEDLRLAFVAQNAGSGLTLYREKFDLPAGYKAAAARRVLGSSWLTVQVTQRPIGGFSASAGAEYRLVLRGDNSVFARAGYASGPGSDAGSGLALGLGLGNSTLKLDYAFTPFGELGNIHRLSLSARFGAGRETPGTRPPAKNDPYERGLPMRVKNKKQPGQRESTQEAPESGGKKSRFTW